jgi:hypothetical protein
MAAQDSVRDKVDAIFRALVQERAEALKGDTVPHAARAAVASALASETDLGSEQADEMALHLTDWNSEAAFLVAVILYPERFTPEEISDGIIGCMVHVPDHLMAACRIGGYDVADEFYDRDAT